MKSGSMKVMGNTGWMVVPVADCALDFLTLRKQPLALLPNPGENSITMLQDKLNLPQQFREALSKGSRLKKLLLGRRRTPKVPVRNYKIRQAMQFTMDGPLAPHRIEETMFKQLAGFARKGKRFRLIAEKEEKIPQNEIQGTNQVSLGSLQVTNIKETNNAGKGQSDYFVQPLAPHNYVTSENTTGNDSEDQIAEGTNYLFSLFPGWKPAATTNASSKISINNSYLEHGTIGRLLQDNEELTKNPEYDC